MTTIAEVREAIALAVESVVKATPYVTEQVNTPQAVVVRGEINYDDTMDGTAAYDYVVTVYATRDARHAQEFLDELSEPEGTGSLKAAVESHSGLADLVHYAVVYRASTPRAEIVGETPYIAQDFTVRAVV